MIARVVILVQDSRFRRALMQELRSVDVHVESMKPNARSWRALHREACDLVVADHDIVPEPVPESIILLKEVPDAPTVALVSWSGDTEESAKLLAAGADLVLEATTPTQLVAEVLATQLEQRRGQVSELLTARPVLVQPRLSDFISKSPVMNAFMEVVERVASSTVSLLILGETGVGKERLARAIHNESPRSDGPFVAINCGALPESLLESELFGHERGAFTGAVRSRRGCFEVAHGGTVFLDEIAEMQAHLQVKLLRVLQDREVRRLGAEKEIAVDVRIMAATNRDLEDDVSEGRFRRDLYYRLGVMTLTLPALKDRREDIPGLAEGYLQFLRSRVGRDVNSISRGAMEALTEYEWPGNVRELINVVERAMLLTTDDRITQAELPLAISQHGIIERAVVPVLMEERGAQEDLPEEWLDRPWREVRREVVARVERAYLAGLLRRCEGRISPTAYMAGMEPRSLFEKMRRHGLRKEDYKKA